MKLHVIDDYHNGLSLQVVMVMIPIGADGESRPDLLIKKPRTIANCEDYR